MKRALEVLPTNSQPNAPVDHAPMTTIPASWYVAIRSSELGKAPVAITLFGRPLVVWRDHRGAPVIQSQYCVHLGASLAHGKVVDGCIQCPFHRWRFDGSGTCVEIPSPVAPGGERIPKTAQQPTYPSAEKYGYVWVWYGTENPLYSLPNLPTAEKSDQASDDYLHHHFQVSSRGCIQQALENQCDLAHFVTVHGLRMHWFEMAVREEEERTPRSQPIVEKEAWFGVKLRGEHMLLGPKLDRFLGLKPIADEHFFDAWPSGICVTGHLNGKERYRVVMNATPITNGRSVFHFLVMTRKIGIPLINEAVHALFAVRTRRAVLQDIRIFEIQQYTDQGCFTKQDGAMLKFRKFHKSWIAKVDQGEPRPHGRAGLRATPDPKCAPAPSHDHED